MFQETRTRHLRARNAADKGEESMTGMRFFVNLIPEAVKRRPRERGPSLHRDFLANAVLSPLANEMEREKRNGERQTEGERREKTTVYRFSRRLRPGAAEVTSHRGPHAHIAFYSLSKDNDPS